MGRPRLDIKGQRFGKLLAIEPVGKHPTLGILWQCLCDCKKTKAVPAGVLRGGKTRSCGCLPTLQSRLNLLRKEKTQ